MRKKYLSLLAFIIALLCISMSAFDLPFKAAQYIFHHDNRFFPYSVSMIVRDRLGSAVEEQTVIDGMLEFVYSMVLPEEKPRTWGEVWWLITGMGYCDHSSRVLTALLELHDIKGYTAYLMNDKGISHHSVAFITPDDDEHHKVNFVFANSIVEDPAYGLYWASPKGRRLSPKEICLKESKPYPINKRAETFLRKGGEKFQESLRKHFCHTPKIRKWNTPLAQRSLTDRFFFSYVLPVLPDYVLKTCFDLALWLLKGRKVFLGMVPIDMDEAAYTYFQARLDHLFFDTNGAKEKYVEVTKAFPDTIWARQAARFLDRLEDIKRIGEIRRRQVAQR